MVGTPNARSHPSLGPALGQEEVLALRAVRPGGCHARLVWIGESNAIERLQMHNAIPLFSRRLWLPLRTTCIHGASTDPLIASGRSHSRLSARPLFWRPDKENRMGANSGEPANKDS